MKEKFTILFLCFLAFLTIFAISNDTSNSQEIFYSTETPLVSSEVIRLHILANSDSSIDQKIKLQIRDILLPHLNATAQTASSKEDALLLLKEQCDTFTNVINQTLSLLGVDYTASISISNLYFPIRIYGSQTYLSKDAVIFPPGYYDSVQVILGKGTGHNWWCLAYPSLCFIDATYEYIPKNSTAYTKKFATVKKSTLDKLFYGSVAEESSNEENIDVYFSSKILNLFLDFFTN